jgi:hypothetical protein
MLIVKSAGEVRNSNLGTKKASQYLLEDVQKPINRVSETKEIFSVAAIISTTAM